MNVFKYGKNNHIETMVGAVLSIRRLNGQAELAEKEASTQAVDRELSRYKNVRASECWWLLEVSNKSKQSKLIKSFV